MTRVLLVGAMGSGKSAVGASLAAKTGWTYVDNDALLLRTSGLTARALQERDGQPALHDAEATVLTLQLGLPEPIILGIAGAAVLTAATRQRLREAGHVVWLRATPAVLARRLGKNISRPLPAGMSVLALLTSLAAERDALYAEVAGQIVDVDVVTAGMAAKAVLAALGPAAAGR